MEVTPGEVIIVHQGSLAISKRHVLKSRKKRWFVLEQRTAKDQDVYFSLRFYKDRSRTYLDGEVPLADISTLTSRRISSFRLTNRTKKTYDLKADNDREKIVWMARLQEIMGKQESYYVQMTSAQEVFPLDSLLRVTQGDLVLMCPVTTLPTHSWKVASLHSFGTSGPQLWLQKCGKCNPDASGLVYLTIGSGVASCEDIFHQVCSIAGGNGTQDSNILSQLDSSTGHARICYISAHQGHEQHTPTPTPQQGRAILLNRALSPEALASSSVPDDVWSSQSVSHDQDSGISTRSNSGILNAAHHCSPYHASAIRQGSLPIPSRSMSIQRRLRKGSLPLLDYPVSSASCGSLDMFNKIAEDEPLPARSGNRDPENVFVFMQCPPQPPPRVMPSTTSSSDSLTQMMKKTRASSPGDSSSPLLLPRVSRTRQHGPPPSPPIPPRPATTLVSNAIPKRKCPSA